MISSSKQFIIDSISSMMDQTDMEKKMELSASNPNSNSEERKRKDIAKFNRTLKYHDLDSCLIYVKRDRKTVQQSLPKITVPTQKKQIKKQKPQINQKPRMKQVLKLKAQIKNKTPGPVNLEISSIKLQIQAPKTSVNQQLPQKQQVKNEQQNQDLLNIIEEPRFDQKIIQAKIEVQEKFKQQASEKDKLIKSTEINFSERSDSKNSEINQDLPERIAEIQIPKNLVKDIEKKVFNKQNKKKRRKNSYDSDEYQQYKNYKFPFSNTYIDKITQQYLDHLGQLDKIKEQQPGNSMFPSQTYINCDVKYFNWQFFIDKIGSFDIIMIDPPWRIKGAQQNDSQFMFSNCKFSLEYNTMSNKDIGNLNIGKLSDNGFIFLWILNSQLDSTLEILNQWGYQVIDQIIWVKLRDQKIYLTHGYYFMHSYQMCLIGYKQNANKSLNCIPCVSNNVLFAEVRKKSQKPDDLYNLIELMFPGSNKLEIFARNNNLRFGWFSLGNQLGESYDKWLINMNCDKCHTPLKPKMKRFKSKKIANYDLCQKCVNNVNKSDFFEIQNQADEDITHLYRSCNKCQTQPIWGPRFQCKVCLNFDLCQNCYDHNLIPQKRFHDLDHDVDVVEIPIFGHGFNLHDVKCNICFQNPLIGICFACKYCKNFNLCQTCFFKHNSTELQASSKSHKADHSMQAIFDPSSRPMHKKFCCFSCSKQILNDCWMCQNCFNFYFCQDCYDKKSEFKTMMANSHKNYHHYYKIF